MAQVIYKHKQLLQPMYVIVLDIKPSFRYKLLIQMFKLFELFRVYDGH